MHIMTVLGDSLGNQLFNGIFSLQFLQFLIAFLSYFGFVLTSAIILILAERKIMGWMQDRLGPIHTADSYWALGPFADGCRCRQTAPERGYSCRPDR